MRSIAYPYGAQARAAIRLGVSRPHLSKILNGHRQPPPKLAVAILADVELRDRGLTLGELLGVEITPGTPLGDGVVAAVASGREGAA